MSKVKTGRLCGPLLGKKVITVDFNHGLSRVIQNYCIGIFWDHKTHFCSLHLNNFVKNNFLVSSYG